MRFSKYFKINKSQPELDFVDCSLDRDIPLFIDPYAIQIAKGDWIKSCKEEIINYFQLIISAINSGDDDFAFYLFSHFSEPNETRLGFSQNKPAGRGVGRFQANDLFKRFKTSEAVKTGFIKDLADCELLIPGINADKISDMTTNIIRRQLIEYTQDQCDLYTISMSRVSAGIIWNLDEKQWESVYAHLPVYNNTVVLLVPKAIVRHRLLLDYQDYYDKIILDFLEAEEINAGSSLVKLLKNGEPRVLKMDLRRKYPCTKQRLYEISNKNPELLDKYKRNTSLIFDPLKDEEIEEFQFAPEEYDFNHFYADLNNIQPGNDDAHKYHKLILGVLLAVFYPSLRNHKMEKEINLGTKRVDIIFDIISNDGFFFELDNRHNIYSPYVMFECKNYSDDIGNPELDQILGRFSPKRGKFGIIVCRSIQNHNAMIKRCREAYFDDKGCVIVLDDTDIQNLLKSRSQEKYEEINDYMRNKLDEIVLS